MKLISFLIVGIVLSVNAASYSQETKLYLALNSGSLVDALRRIEDQSEFYFYYNNADINDIDGISVDIKGEKIQEVMAQLLADTGLEYKIIDRYIVVKKEESSSLPGVVSQPQSISGNVTDSSGLPLPGVTVIIKGTTDGTITDFDGKFILGNVPNDATLGFSFVGMKAQEIEVGGRNSIDVIMQEETIGLEEVVAVGYGTQKKISLTGAISQVSSEDLAEVSSPNAVQRIQGKVSGVTIINSHTPGGEATVRVRGMGTINNNDPLYIIDGVPTKEGMSLISPNDIESMTVLKDASSAAIYGARGANGVIIITTKKGSGDKPKISFSARTGLQRASNKYDLLNAEEYGELLWLEAKNSGVTPGNDLYGYGNEPVIPYYALAGNRIANEGDPAADISNYRYEPGDYNFIVKSNQQGTDWYDEILRTAIVHDYNLSVSGGTDKGNYAFSGGYYHEDGIIEYTDYDRYSLRSNASSKFKDWFEIGENLGLVYSERNGNSTDNNEESAVSFAYRMQPIIPAYDVMGNFAGTSVPATGNARNPIAMLYRDKDDFSRNMRATGSTYAQITFLKNFRFKTLLGVDYLGTNTQNITRINPESSEPLASDILEVYDYNTLQYNWANTINFNRTYNEEHNINVILGTEIVDSRYRYVGAIRSGFFTDNVDYMYIDAGEEGVRNAGSGTDWKTQSFFGRVNYDYIGKYLLEATFRRDGSSRFGRNNRWGNFPAFSAGWRLSEESFMEGTRDWLDNLKVRVGWGMSGNDEIGNYNGFTTFRTNVAYSYYSLTGSDTSTETGYDSNAFGNPNAKWEATTTTNIGVDMSMLNGKITFGIDAWQRKTTDMLFQKAIPDVVGDAIAPYVNIGEMNNKGLDFTGTYRGDALGGDLKYSVTANVSIYKNKIVKLTDNEDEFLAGAELRSMSYTRSYVGWEYPSFFGYVVDGIFQTQEEADAWPSAIGENGDYNKPGHFKYRDINDDGVIDDKDRTKIGSPHPDFYGGLTLDLQYENFDLSAFFNGSYGNDMVNVVNRWINYNNFMGNRSKDRLYNSWGSPYLKDNGDAKLAIAETNDAISQEPSSHFVEDASYLRLKSLQLGYNLSKASLDKLGISKLRIYLQASNLFTITGYSGLDPEGGVTPGGSDALMGVDSGGWPTAQQFMIGVNLGL